MPPKPWSVCIAALFTVSTAQAVRAQQDSTTRPAVAGAFTEAQAGRGQATFRRICAQCHVVSQFSGVSFRRAWAGRPAFELYELIRTTMPQDNPGRLPPQDYTDVIAYFLSLGGAHAGSSELAAEPDTLRKVLFPPVSPTRN